MRRERHFVLVLLLLLLVELLNAEYDSSSHLLHSKDCRKIESLHLEEIRQIWKHTLLSNRLTAVIEECMTV